ncbi:MAG: ABC transporter substrate-binding protein, partial [Methanobacterium sp.]
MNTKKIITLAAITIIALFGVIGTYVTNQSFNPSNGNQIKDMIGRNINIPPQINKVYSLSASTTVELFMIAPDKMVGWDAQRAQEENIYMPDKYKNLPVYGGGKKDANYESIISSNPDIILIGHGGTVEDVNELQQKFGKIPAIDVEGDNNLTSVSPSINFLGKVLGEQENADKLTNYYNKVLKQVNDEVATIPDNEKKKVYYARNPNGLTSFAPGDQHTNLINICGGKNVVQA